MRKLLRILLFRPILWAANKFSSKPDKERVFDALSKLHENILANPGKRGPVIPFESTTGKFIIFSDQHKGRRNGADDFKLAEPNYLAALKYYNENGYFFINLGDSEELWENSLWQLKKKNKETFEAEKKFLVEKNYIKIFGNHDLYWDNDPFAWWQLKDIFGEKLKVFEGVVLQTSVNIPISSGTIQQNDISGMPITTQRLPLSIFLTHGHQGDAQSDGNWFTKFFVANLWAPLQAYLRINPNTPAYNAEKKTLHNIMMYEWSSEQKNILLITGHTHQPVFESLTYLERLYKRFQIAQYAKNESEINKILSEIKKVEKKFHSVSSDYMKMKPTYFNSGCCCFNDGDITGIEIADGVIKLIKWETENGRSVYSVQEEMSLQLLAELIQ